MVSCDLQPFVDCLEDAVVVLDDNFRIILANPVTLRHFGRAADEILNQPCYVVFRGRTAPCDSQPFGTCAVQKARATGQPARARHDCVDVSGINHAINILASPLAIDGRRPTVVMELVREIARQVELEAETAYYRRELSVLDQITSAVTRSLDPEALAPELLDLLSAALEIDGAAIYQCRDEAPVQLAAGNADWSLPVVNALADEMVHLDTPLVLEDARAAEGGTKPLSATTASGSLLCLPLSDGEGPRKWLVLTRSRSRPWSEPDVRLAVIAARQMAVGLERGRLYQAEAERARRLEKANLRLHKLEQERRQAVKRAISAQEDERKRIAEELHDDTAQSLAALIVGLDTAAAMLDHSPALAREQLAHLKRCAGAIAEEVDRTIAALRPALLDDLGLVPALQAYTAERLDPLGVAWEFHLNGDECVPPPPADMVLFRVVQEAVGNIARHAHAHRVSITVLPEAGGITIEVSDDGIGFDVKEKSDPGRRQSRFGLLGMQERLEMVGGLLDLQSAPGQGTRLRIFVPWETEGAKA